MNCQKGGVKRDGMQAKSSNTALAGRLGKYRMQGASRAKSKSTTAGSGVGHSRRDWKAQRAAGGKARAVSWEANNRGSVAGGFQQRIQIVLAVQRGCPWVQIWSNM
jgi:hypothetical protein